MPNTTFHHLPADLAQGQRQFQNWKRRRKIGARIPETLWAEAVQLAQIYGVSRTAKTLGVDYYSLKHRLRLNPRHPRQCKPDVSSTPTFVELPPLPQTTSAECVMELQDAAGARMRLLLKGYHAADVARINTLKSVWLPELGKQIAP